MQAMFLPEVKSSSVASGYSVFMLRIARRDIMTSFNAFLNALKGIYHGFNMNRTINILSLTLKPYMHLI